MADAVHLSDPVHRPGHWLEVLADQHDGSDYDDAEDVNGWLSATLSGTDTPGTVVLTVAHESAASGEKVYETYRVTYLGAVVP